MSEKDITQDFVTEELGGTLHKAVIMFMLVERCSTTPNGMD
jgi:hypothetical protein